MIGPSPVVRPYKGLVPYYEDDAAFFFGREAEHEIISANLMASRLTLLWGASGVGKSSVLRAGVAYGLRQLAHQNLIERHTPEFAVVVFNSWRDDPLSGLTARIQDEVKRTLEGRSVDTLPASRSLVECAQNCTDQLEGDLLVILDQFEEYFLYHPQEKGEGTFAVEFPRVVKRPDLRISFLISIREDALAKLDRFKGRIPNLFDNYYRVEHLNREAAHAAITKPLEHYNSLPGQEGKGVTIEPELVEAVLDQVRSGNVVVGEGGRGVIGSDGRSNGEHIETPYLQLVMTRLWEEEMRAGSRVLRRETLDRLRGADHIVRTHLDSAMSGLPAEEQDVAGRVFNYLVTPSGTKIAHAASDLAEYAGLTESTLGPVLEKLAGHVRILRAVAPSAQQPGTPRYEIFHDVLAAPILDWRSRHVAEQERVEHHAKLKRTRKRAAQLRWVVAALTLLLMAVGALTLFAIRKKQEATAAELAAKRTAKTDQFHEQVTKLIAGFGTDPSTSLESAIKVFNELGTEADKTDLSLAHRVVKQSLVESHLRVVFRENGERLESAAFSPNGKFVLTSGNKELRVWDADTGKYLSGLSGNTDFHASAFFSPDNDVAVAYDEEGTLVLWRWAESSPPVSLTHKDKEGSTVKVLSAAFIAGTKKQIASVGADGMVRFSDAATGKGLRELTLPTPVKTAAFSRAGDLLVTTHDFNSPDFNSRASLWQVSSGRKLAELTVKDSITCVAFTSNGDKFVVGTGTIAIVLDIRSGQKIILAGHRGNVSGAAFSPDNESVATVSFDQTVRLWNARTGILQALQSRHTDVVNSVAFSPDGKFIVTAGDDGAAFVCEARTLRAWTELRGHTGDVKVASFSPDGRSVLTASADGSARIWESGIGASTDSSRGSGHNGNITSLASNGENLFITSSTDGTAKVWRADTGTQVVSFNCRDDGADKGEPPTVNSAAFSPDGSLAVTAGQDGVTRVWSVITGKQLSALKTAGGAINNAVFSPSAKYVAASSDNSNALVWEWEKPQSPDNPIVLSGHKGVVRSIAFSPDGTFVVTASADQTARVWNWSDEASRQHPFALVRDGHKGSVRDASFNRDGSLVLTAGNDGTARIWDWRAETLRHALILQANATDLPVNAVFSPDGTLVLTTGRAEMTISVWDATTGEKKQNLIGHNRQINDIVFSPDGLCLISVSSDWTARLWDTETWECVAVLRGHTASLNGAAFNTNGKLIATASEDKTARFYQCEVCGPWDEVIEKAKRRVERIQEQMDAKRVNGR